jgi:predicted phage terminase large subunit-like protein
VRESTRWTRLLAGIDAHGDPVRLDKIARSKPFLAAAEQGRVKVLQAPWTSRWLDHMHNQPELPHDDMYDATSGAFSQLMKSSVMLPKARVEIM